MIGQSGVEDAQMFCQQVVAALRTSPEPML
jgi:hypothetical protein